jgi:hypothetical protein
MKLHIHLFVTVAWLIGLHEATAQVTFAPAISNNVAGPLPEYLLSVVAADINGDGHVDLICANANGYNICVLTNNGSGIFGSNATYTVGRGPMQVIAADLNSVGKLDLITANAGDNTLTVLTNNGIGVFGSNATLHVGNEPRSVTTADVRGTGKLDLISANFYDNTLTVLTNNGSGMFGSNATYNVGSLPTSVAAADINGDGKMDLICADYLSNTLTVLTNNGSGVFGYFATLVVDNGPYSVVAADLNGDGKMDLVSANLGNTSYSYTLSVLTNSGNGVFGASVNYTVGNSPNSVVAADVNGDRKLDLICANQNPTQIGGQWIYSLSVLTNNGSGGFVSALSISTVPENGDDDPYSVTAADVNGDGKMDLIYADKNNNNLWVLVNTSVYPTPPNLGISTYSNQPVVFFPAAAGANFVLQMTTNLASGNWVTVSNGISISGLIITNPPSNAFFRLH